MKITMTLFLADEDDANAVYSAVLAFKQMLDGVCGLGPASRCVLAKWDGTEVEKETK